MGLIDIFREKMSNLSLEEQKAAPRTLEDLSYPCQVIVIWAKEPEFQIVTFAHIGDLEDKLTELCGPIENSELISYIEKEVLNSPIASSIGKEKMTNFITWELSQIRTLYNPLEGSPKPHLNGMIRIHDDPFAFGWIVVGNLANLDLKEVVDECIGNVISTAKPSPATPTPEEKVILEGFGTFIYPPAWIGEVPQPSFRERISGYPFWKHSWERAITEVYKHNFIVLTEEGYIAVGEKERVKALEHINEIMSTLLVLGVHVYIVRENDLGEATFREKGAQWSYGGLRASLFDQRFPEHPELLLTRRTVLEKEKVKKAIRLAEILTSDEKIKTLLLLFLESHTHQRNSEYKQALLVSWVMLEDFYIKDLWSQTISKLEADEDRMGKLGSWSVDHKLETLSVAHIITDTEYDLLMQIKDARNEVFHEGKEPRKELVEKCLELVSGVVQKYVGNRLGAMLSAL